MKDYLKRIVYFICSLTIAPFLLFLKLGNLVSRTDDLFSGQGQLLSLIPGKVDSYLRIAYYHLALENCPLDGYIGFGSFFPHTEVSLGKAVYIGAYCIIGKAIGKDVTIGNGSTIMADIGRQNVIGARTIVVKQTGDYEVRVGNPARFIRSIKSSEGSPSRSFEETHARS